jgi:hypothetical protein
MTYVYDFKMWWNCGWRWDNKAIPFISFLFIVFKFLTPTITPLLLTKTCLGVVRTTLKFSMHTKIISYLKKSNTWEMQLKIRFTVITTQYDSFVT